MRRMIIRQREKKLTNIEDRLRHGETCIFRSSTWSYLVAIGFWCFPTYLAGLPLKFALWWSCPLYVVLFLLIRQKLELFPDRLKNTELINHEHIFNFSPKGISYGAIRGYKVQFSKAGNNIALLDEKGNVITRIARSLAGYADIQAWLESRYPEL
jgi:hypothetical protein